MPGDADEQAPITNEQTTSETFTLYTKVRPSS
jgi:hypothetical protein